MDELVPTTEKYAKVYDNQRRQIYVIDGNKKIYQLWLDTFAGTVYCYVKGQRVPVGEELGDIIGDFQVVVYDGAGYIETDGEGRVQIGNHKINLFGGGDDLNDDIH